MVQAGIPGAIFDLGHFLIARKREAAGNRHQLAFIDRVAGGVFVRCDITDLLLPNFLSWSSWRLRQIFRIEFYSVWNFIDKIGDRGAAVWTVPQNCNYSSGNFGLGFPGNLFLSF